MAVKLRGDIEFLSEDGVVWAVDNLTGFELALRDLKQEPGSQPEAMVSESSRELLDKAAFYDTGLSKERILEIQALFMRSQQPVERLRAVRELLTMIRSSVPFYRDRAERYDPERVHSLHDFAATVPVQTKSDLRLNFDDLIFEDVAVGQRLKDRTLELAATSGTTGERLQVLSDMTVDSVPQEYEAIWNLTGDEEYIHKTAVFTAPICLGRECRLGKSSYEERVRGDSTLYLNSTADLFSLKRDLAENIIEELNRFEPDLLLVNPVYLHWLLRCSDEWKLAMPKIQAVLSCYQYMSEIQRKAIHGYLGAPAFNYYLATDLAGSRLGVDSCCGRMHVREDHSYVEVVAEDGKPKPDGEIGALLFTAHANRVMPMVRYQIGDVGRLVQGGADSCPIAHWQTLELHGRAKDMLCIGGRWWTTREIDSLMANVPGVDFYKIYQDDEASLRIDFVSSPAATFDGASSSSFLGDALAIADIQFTPVDRLEAEVSMKFRMTQCTYREAPSSP